MNQKAFTPSVLSASIDILVTIVFTAVAIIASLRPHSSSLNQEFFFFHKEFSATYTGLSTKLAQNRFINDLPLFLFWALVGIAVYLLVMEIIKSVNSTIELADDINNVNASKKNTILKETAVRSSIRIVTVIIWYVYLRLFILKFVPLYLSYIHKFSVSRNLHNSLSLALMALAFLLLLHVNTVVFRFIALKKRLISKYEE